MDFHRIPLYSEKSEMRLVGIINVRDVLKYLRNRQEDGYIYNKLAMREPILCFSRKESQ